MNVADVSTDQIPSHGVVNVPAEYISRWVSHEGNVRLYQISIGSPTLNSRFRAAAGHAAAGDAAACAASTPVFCRLPPRPAIGWLPAARQLAACAAAAAYAALPYRCLQVIRPHLSIRLN